MSEYIERENVLDILRGKGAAWDAYAKVQSLPAADVRPVVRGMWVYDENGMDWNIPAWVCSECHARNDAIPPFMKKKDRTVRTNPYMWSCSKFCPNCGAMMEES